MLSALFSAVTPLIIILILLIVLLAMGIYIVPQQSVVIIERLGRFNRASGAGIHVLIPFIERKAGLLDLRIAQLENRITTKTKDDTFVQLAVAVQYRIEPTRVYQAFYELSNPQQQIKSYIEDSVRNSVPEITLDQTFSQKDMIAGQVKALLQEKMTQFGYNIISTLITDIQPDQSVVNAMNSINEAQRRRQAARELAEAEKITVVTAAEAQRDEMRLHGEGVAAQRQAIIDGLVASVADLKDTGLDSREIMAVILANQYIDVLNGFAESENSKVIFANGTPTGIEDVRQSIISSLEAC